ncbi:hypothetical protein [Polyangium aurulentum]|uniref:hypothetical protein n=1 Tax=Polyangium aurulentum TaxID=2567896 RepID=UPI0010ADF1AE|nr:hypothetical protein [Polyangium aurulentum]UQA61311.1 hypothetical protein E8A73_012865 [Polyangium aurulentum]
MRYRIPLMGNPGMDLALRAKYIAAFGDACYLSEGGAFNCFYKTPQEACDAGVLVAEVFGAAPYDKNYPACERIAGTENYARQVGPDPAINIVISYEPAPRQTPLVEVDGVPTEVSGPYRNLPELKDLWPGNHFYCYSGMVDGNGDGLTQQAWILQVNRNAHKGDAGVGEIHSDLAGFKWPCTVMNEKCEEVTVECEEPLVLPDPEDPVGTKPNVHHVVPMTDKRSCPWGTNSNKNAAVISAKLNKWLSNKNPPEEEVKRLKAAPAYTP